MTIDDLTGINFADIYWDPQQPPRLVKDELLKMTPKYPELRAAGLVLHTVSHAARLVDIPPDEALALVLSPEGKMKVWRDFAQHWTAYLASDQRKVDVKALARTGTSDEIYIGCLHDAYTSVLEIVNQLQEEPAFRRRAVELYNGMVGVPVYVSDTARTTSPALTPSSSSV